MPAVRRNGGQVRIGVWGSRGQLTESNDQTGQQDSKIQKHATMKLTSLKAIFFVMLPDSRLLPAPPCPTAPVEEDRLPEPPDQLFQQQLISPVQKSKGGREHIEAAKNATRGTLNTNTKPTTTTIATTATTVTTTTTLATDLSYSPPRHTYVTEQTRPYTFAGDHLRNTFDQLARDPSRDQHPPAERVTVVRIIWHSSGGHRQHLRRCSKYRSGLPGYLALQLSRHVTNRLSLYHTHIPIVTICSIRCNRFSHCFFHVFIFVAELSANRGAPS